MCTSRSTPASRAARDSPGRQVGVVEVADPLLDAGERGGAAGASYDGAHGRAALDQCRAGARADEAVGPGDHDEGGGWGARLTHADTMARATRYPCDWTSSGSAGRSAQKTTSKPASVKQRSISWRDSQQTSNPMPRSSE